MSANDASVPRSLPLTNALNVYRQVTRWVDIEEDNTIKLTAFFRRDDEDGLSVQRADMCEIDAKDGIRPAPLGGGKGVASLVVGRLRAIDGEWEGLPTKLDVVHMPTERLPAECEILNIPVGPPPLMWMSPEANKVAIRIAQELARIGAAVWIKERK